jgi:hypothetical protein
MGGSRTQGDQRLPWSQAADDNGDWAHSDLVSKMLWALFALLLMTTVAVVSYLAGHASLQEPLRFGGETTPVTRQAPATPPVTIPHFASPPPSTPEAPPPVTRMLEVKAKTRIQTAVADQQVTNQRVTPAIRELPSQRVPEFRPPRRVRDARRAIARRLPVEPQPVVYASRVVQLGEYPNRREARAAHVRLVKVYPYLKTLRKTIEPTGPLSAHVRAYHLRVTAYSPEHARVLCQNLLSIGRGCAVLPEPA